MIHRRTIAAAALAAAFSMGLAVVPSAGRAAEPFTINAIVPETGAAAFLGKEEAQALGVVEKMVNASGGIGGRPIKFQIYDDQSDPQTSVQVFNSILASKPPVVLGPSFVSTCSAIAPLVTNGPVLYCFSPGIHPRAGSYAFSESDSTVDLLAVAARYFHERGWQKIALITSTDATGQDADRGVQAAFGPRGSGATIVSHEHFNMSDLTVGAQMARIKASGAQAIVAWTTGSAFGTILHGAADAGLRIPILTSTGNLTYAQMHSYAKFMHDNVYFAAAPFVSPNQVRDSAVKRAVDAYHSAFEPLGVKPDVGQSLGWDAPLLVIDAFKHLGLDATAAQIREYLSQIGAKNKFVGIYGAYDFAARPQRGLAQSGVEVVRWDSKTDGWVGASELGGALAAK